MAITAHVYQIYIAADPDQVWTAITTSEWTARYLHQTSYLGPLAAGQPYRTVTADGRPAIDGVIEELSPPADGRPGRLVQTWHILYDPELSAEPAGRVEWTVEQAGERLTRVRLVHGDLAGSPLTWASVKDGWVWVLDNLKSVLETGTALSRVADYAGERAVSEADWHRAQGVEANNSVWDLIAKSDRTPEDDEDMLRRAYAAAYHWQRTPSAEPANEARASYLIAKVLVLTDQPERGLLSADRCLRICQEHELADFDLAYAYEVRARALLALGRDQEAAHAWAAATAVPIADEEDRAIVEADFANYPG